jgi:hypothetical protein
LFWPKFWHRTKCDVRSIFSITNELFLIFPRNDYTIISITIVRRYIQHI